MATSSTTYTVSGMTCGHCVAAVTAEVSKIDGVVAVDIDLPTGTVTIESVAPINAQVVALAVDEAGYELVP